ncbi:MAG: MBL fold metallo-hydrolase [Eubacterium sp.]
MTVYRYITGPIDVNTYLVFDETGSGFVVDPGGHCPELVDDIKNKGIDVKFIILTHAHADHIGAVEEIKALTGAKVLLHKDDEEMLENPRLNTSIDLLFKPISLKGDAFVDEDTVLKVGNMTLKFLHTPGHSKGGLSIVTDGAVFSGDTLFRASVGRTDFYGGNAAELLSSIKDKLFKLPDDTVVYTGHMQPTTIEFEKRYNPFVQD